MKVRKGAWWGPLGAQSSEGKKTVCARDLLCADMAHWIGLICLPAST